MTQRIASLLLLATACWAQDVPPRPEGTRGLTRSRMGRIAAGEFIGRKVEGPVSGWVMTNEKGVEFQRSILVLQADALIPLGEEAVPELLRWLEHEEMQVRFIAHLALEKITGLDPHFPHFATLEQLRSRGLLEECRRAWREWYYRRRNAQDF